jgi:serine/threonine-protein kinase RsbW
MYQKVFPAELDCLYKMLEFIKDYGQALDVPSDILDQIILAAEEALVNIISYGYPDDQKGTIDIACEHSIPLTELKIIIKDSGVAFNPIENAPAELPQPSTVLSKPEHSLGGYGIYILIELMDQVEYQRVKGENILSMTKYL